MGRIHLRKILKPLSQQAKGYSLIELLFGVALVALVALGVMQLTGQSTFMKVSLDTADTALRIRAQLLSEIENETSWSFTLTNAANPSFDCVNKKTDCAAFKDVQTPITIFGNSFTEEGVLADSFIPITAVNPTRGFDRYGRACNTFNAVSGDTNCIYQYRATWQAVCPAAGACINPQVLLRATLGYKSSGLKVGELNPDKYAISTYVMEPNSFGAICAKLGGVFDPVTKRCTLPMAGRCPFGTVLGIDVVAKLKICGIPLAQPIACPPGEKFMGVDDYGVPFCAAVVCGPPTCSLPPPFCPCIGSGCDGPPNMGGGGDGGDGCDGGDGGCK